MRERKQTPSKSPGKSETRGERNIRWIEKHLRVPDGRLLGQPLKLKPWQRKIVKGIYDTPTRTAIVSVGRKNGKTALAAALLLLHLCGPEARPNSELYSSALSRDQAAIIFRLASKMIRLSPELRDCVTIRDTTKQLYVPELGTLYCALSADASTNFGLSPVFVCHDELGQVKGERHPLYEALETATGAQESPLSIVISTQAPTDGDLLSRLIDDARAADKDSLTKLFFWTAEESADPFADDTIRQANPAFDDFQNADEIRRMAQEAKRMPSREASYRNLILNQRVEASNPFVTRSVWLDNAEDPDELGTVYAGLDLSETNDLTALVMVSPAKTHLNVKPVFWLPAEGLAERARLDRVPYDVWVEQGWLQTTPGKSIEYEYVACYIAGLFEKHDVRKIAFDRYNMRHFRPWLVKAGLSEAFIDSRFVEFGQGYVSMSPALRTLESLLLNKKLRHGDHPALSMCAANAVVKMDEAGNRKLDKRKSNGRIDGMVALAMACSVSGDVLHERHVYQVPVERITESLHA